ncbi:hypothetical protein CIL05_06365 [Virgibacillus profundi]|uniref:Group-specific protein n=1 Tax=Virgibacillus profundi TaxID=2024555 RepID=A0A2A2IGQ3_9BACI|nr:hypothetical protein [Virgibacillus profundi]PAV30722.1 hypothetical protein CIL05_06365 [Virgibacillus profundi]PXY54894.1 hypothetical protein CIT14_06450 [Virgibacillus profundi]
MIKRRNLMRVFGVAALIMIANIIYKISSDKNVDVFDVLSLGTFVLMFISTITWGNKEEKNGLYQGDELGQRIMEKSSKISYTILLFTIMVAVFADKFVNGTVNLFLLLVLGFAMITYPFVEYFIAKKYK